MANVRDLGLDQRCGIIDRVGPIRSLRGLAHMSGVPGVYVPDDIGHRLRSCPADRVADEGLRICADIIQQVLQIPGVSGIHVMAPGFEQAIPEILGMAGLGRPAAAELAAGQRSGCAH
jgi:methylenetetrahydrofolate reductase (NADPH)